MLFSHTLALSSTNFKIPIAVKNTFFLLLTAVLAASCGGGKRSFASEEEAITYANDNSNGFIATTESGGHIFSAKVNPILAGEESVTINFRISREDGQSVLQHHTSTPTDVNQKEMYLSFDLNKDVYLRVDGKDVAPILHHYERNYKLKPEIDISFTFPKVEPKGDVQLVYRDNLFGTGLQELEFDKAIFEPYTITQ